MMTRRELAMPNMIEEHELLQKMQQLKPCPFCGGEASEMFATVKDNSKGVQCKNCGAGYMPVFNGFDTRNEAIKAWNTRATPIPDTPEIVRALDDAYEAGRKSAERTCKPTIEYHGDLIKTTYPCCGYELKEYKYSPYPEVAFNYCPSCGAKVVE